MKFSFFLSAILFASTASLALGAKPEIFGKVALKGYDPVAYFKAGTPQKGDKAISYQWKNAEWRFSSADNRDKFIASPEKFAPQYGGYCAWAVSRNYTAATDPHAWKIVDEKLYLNYNKSVRASWEKSAAANIKKADGNWPSVLNK